MPETTYISRYDQRVALVQTVLQKESKLGDKVAHGLAVQILHAIDHIPEAIRR